MSTESFLVKATAQGAWFRTLHHRAGTPAAQEGEKKMKDGIYIKRRPETETVCASALN
jgi:hypothetical protein